MYNQLYLDSHRRVLDLVTPLSTDELTRVTPACPLWSVHDIVAHLAGSSTAFVGGQNEGEPASPEWTAVQVEQRRGRTVAELAEEWQRHAPEIAEIPVSSRSWLPILH